MKWPFNPCRRLEADLSLLAAGDLGGEQRAKVEAHVADCAACRTKLAELRQLCSRVESVGNWLPQVEPTIALRHRWQMAVRHSARQEVQPRLTPPAMWFSGRRATWGSLAAIWLLVFFFRFSAPEAPRPTVFTAAPVSLREVWLALKVENAKSKSRADADGGSYRKQSHPEALPPRSQLLRVQPVGSETA